MDKHLKDTKFVVQELIFVVVGLFVMYSMHLSWMGKNKATQSLSSTFETVLSHLYSKKKGLIS